LAKILKTLKQCDEQLAFDLAGNADAFNAANSAEMGFEYTDQCHGKGNIPTGELECCGDFPARFPFHSRNGARDCCGSRVFNTESHQCCSGDQLVKNGNSC